MSPETEIKESIEDTNRDSAGEDFEFDGKKMSLKRAAEQIYLKRRKTIREKELKKEEDRWYEDDEDVKRKTIEAAKKEDEQEKDKSLCSSERWA